MSELTETRQPNLIFRHAGAVRVTHWINLLCLTILLMSGLQIFNAHPALYTGAQSNFSAPIVAMKAAENDDAKGVTTIFGHAFNTTGWLGVSAGADGSATERGFPRWITFPSEQDLASGRRWHFFFAWIFVTNGLFYLIFGLVSGHVRRDLAPRDGEFGQIAHSIKEHIRLRFPEGDQARRYNILQKLTYLAVIFALLPAMVIAGLAMSPGMDAAFPQILWVFGGRQSARTVHFVLAWGIVLFVLVHVVMVVLSGALNNMRGMITGWYDIGSRGKAHGVRQQP